MSTPPFGRPSGYENNLCRASSVERPTQLSFFGDGHSDVFGVWPQDRRYPLTSPEKERIVSEWLTAGPNG